MSEGTARPNTGGLNLYQIHADVFAAETEACDHETGELNEELFARIVGDLPMKRDEIGLEIAARIVELEAEAAAIKAAAAVNLTRAAAVLLRATRMKSHLQTHLVAGVKLSDERVAIGWIRSTGTIVEIPAENLPTRFRRRVVTITADLMAIKAALKMGKKVKGARLDHRQGITIK